MHRTIEIWSTIGLLMILRIVLPTQPLGQTKDSSLPPIIGGDGLSKDFKLSGPLGVFQLPRQSVRIPRTIRALLPHGAKVRLLQKLASHPEDTLVVYDTLDPAHPNPLIDIRYPGVLVLRSNHVIGRASLKRRTDDGPDWVFLEAGEIHVSPNLPGIALAFRSMGDGSVSLFLLLSPHGGQYRTMLKKITGAGRLRADNEANLELWDANFGEECVWCDHRYSVFNYRWNGSRLVRVRNTITCRTIDPGVMTDKPIEAVQQSLDAEYAESERKRRREQRLLHATFPVRINGVYRGKLGQEAIVMTLGRAKPERWSRCDFRDPSRKRGTRYPIVATYPNRQNGDDTMLAGVPLSPRRIRLWEYRDNRRTHNVWELSITHSGAVGVVRRVARHGSKLSIRSTSVSLKRTSHDFDPYFSTQGGYDW